MKRFLVVLIAAALAGAGAYVFRDRLAGHLPERFAQYLTAKNPGSVSTAQQQAAPRQGAGSAKGASGRRGGGPVTVKVVEAKAGSLPVLRQSFGNIEAKDTTALASPIAGIVASINVKDGAAVKKGDVIVTYDARALHAALAKDKATLAKDQATYDNAEITLTRSTNLGQQGASTQQAIDNAKAALRQAQAALSLDKAQIDADMVAISNTQITAPYDGILGFISVSPGSYVGAGTAVATIVNAAQVNARFTLPESDLDLARSALAKGDLSVAVKPTNASDGTAEVSGKVTFIDNQVDQASGTFRLWALIDNAAKAFWPGESIDVTVTAGHIDNLVLVPNVAISPVQDGMGAYVVGSDNKAELRKVTVVLRSNGVTGVSEGLKNGDRVVVEGQQSLSPGASVAISDGAARKPGQNGKRSSAGNEADAGDRPASSGKVKAD